jgi:hypothetical protein
MDKINLYFYEIVILFTDQSIAPPFFLGLIGSGIFSCLYEKTRPSGRGQRLTLNTSKFIVVEATIAVS